MPRLSSHVNPSTAAAPVLTDAVVIGAGPAGLWTIFQLGLHGIAAHCIDVLPEPGGQCLELYADKPLYDIPGLPATSGRALAQALMQQVAPFRPQFHWNQLVKGLQRISDVRWELQTSEHTWHTRSVVIAAGVGAFLPRTLNLPGLAALEGRQLFYRLKSAAPDAWAGEPVVVLGGEDAAVRAALRLSALGPLRPARITLVHRRDVLQAEPDVLDALAQARADGRIDFVAGQPVAWSDADSAEPHLTDLTLSTPDGGTRTLPCTRLLVCLGISPKLGPLADWGLALQRKQLPVDTATQATALPGIYAVGDVVTYPGKKKLIVSGFHEAIQAGAAIAQQLDPQAPTTVLYTTSSALLQQRLGVVPVPEV
ncbi:MAG: NAD(P)/FAD-dependent oxidoreductase [Rhodoferax sp.]